MKKSIVILGLILVWCTQGLNAQIPETVVGNWINPNTGHWEYGFFEQFAIYQNDFWEYESVVSDKKGNTTLVLRKGKEKVSLTLQMKKNHALKLQRGKEKAVSFVKMDKIYPDYPQKDLTTFQKPNFKSDSITIIGYYRNREKVPEQFVKRLVDGPFRVSASNFISENEDDYFADIDSIGRFKVTIPAFSMRELYVDWQRMQIHLFLDAGDTLLLFADMTDFIPLEKDGSMEGYIERPKQLLFMGDNARLNNEWVTYKMPALSPDRNRGKNGIDMDYLHHCDSISQARMKLLQTHINLHPNVSEKFKVVTTAYERFSSLFYLMQYRFVCRSKGRPTMDAEYIDYVRNKAVLDQEWMYTGLRDFSSFLRDWVGYHEENNPTQVVLTIKDILAYILANRTIPEESLNLLKELVAVNEAFEKAKPEERAAVQEKFTALLEKSKTISPLLTEVATEMINKRPKPTPVSDSLLVHEHLKNLWNARTYFRTMNQSHLPLKPEQLTAMRTSVVIPAVIQQLETMHHFYEKVSETGMTYAASLKNTEHLKEYQDAKALFEELTKPYLGKVIYVDFWGTWCGPCKENMTYVKGLKDKLKGQPIVYMYFANRSPEDSWKAIIKEMDLTGENVVHYRLPEAQEAMIERLFNVTKFPTYLLINKEGKVINTDALSPRMKESTLKQISDLL